MSYKAKWRKRFEYDNKIDFNALNNKGRVVKAIHKKGDRITERAYMYDKRGNIISDTLNINDKGKMTKETFGVQYSYFSDSKLHELTYPGGMKVIYSYDKHGRLSGIGTDENSHQYAKYEYGLNGKIKQADLGSGIINQKYKYDLIGSRKEILALKNGSSLDTLYSQVMDYFEDDTTFNKGNISSISYSGNDLTGNVTVDYLYDSENQLKGSIRAENSKTTSWIYKYDANGNIDSVKYDSDILLPAAPEDLNIGYNYLEGKNIRNDSVSGYPVFDDVGRLKNYAVNGIHASRVKYDNYLNRTSSFELVRDENKKINFFYDSKNRRVEKRKIDESSESEESVIYIHGQDGLPLAEIYKTENGVIGQKNFIHGAGYGPVAVVNGTSYSNENVFYFVRDHLSSLKLAYKGDGTLVGRYDYSPYGVIMEEFYHADAPKIGSMQNAFGYLYAGQEYDEELFLYNFRARLYNPRERIFLQPDVMHQYHSPYTFVGNNPTNHVDRDGNVYTSVLKGGYGIHLIAPHSYKEFKPTAQNRLLTEKGIRKIDLHSFQDATFASSGAKGLGSIRGLPFNGHLAISSHGGPYNLNGRGEFVFQMQDDVLTPARTVGKEVGNFIQTEGLDVNKISLLSCHVGQIHDFSEFDGLAGVSSNRADRVTSGMQEFGAGIRESGYQEPFEVSGFRGGISAGRQSKEVGGMLAYPKGAYSVNMQEGVAVSGIRTLADTRNEEYAVTHGNRGYTWIEDKNNIDGATVRRYGFNTRLRKPNGVVKDLAPHKHFKYKGQNLLKTRTFARGDDFGVPID